MRGASKHEDRSSHIFTCRCRTYTNPVTGQPEKLELRGDWLARRAEITLENGQAVARIATQFLNKGQLIFGQQTYMLSVAPNGESILSILSLKPICSLGLLVDVALMVAICICLDEYTTEAS